MISTQCCHYYGHGEEEEEEEEEEDRRGLGWSSVPINNKMTKRRCDEELFTRALYLDLDLQVSAAVSADDTDLCYRKYID